MAKLSAKAKEKYQELIHEYKRSIDTIKAKQSKIMVTMKKDTANEGLYKLQLANEDINMTSYYILMNSVSQSLLTIKNESFLTMARKCIYRALIHFEEVFSNFIDAPYSEYEELVEKVKDFPEIKRYFLIKKLGFSIDQLKEAFGENSKWKWSFVEMEGRCAVIAKNCIDLKALYAGLDPRDPNYREKVVHFNLTYELLNTSADNYRMKYELSTKKVDDFKTAINYLNALKRISILLNRQADADNLSRKIDIWQTKLANDVKAEEG